MDNYSILLPNEKAGTYRLLTLLIAVLNLLIVGYVFFKQADDHFKYLLLAGIIMNGAGVVMLLISRYLKFRTYFVSEIIFLLNAVIWFIAGKYFVALLLIVFAIVGFYANKDLRIIFSTGGIQYPSFPPRLIKWDEVEQAILKDDILTIDLKNNKLLQFTIPKEGNGGLNETAFNIFCKKNNHKHI